jgi:type IV pilus assembly protein PilM
MASRVVGLDIGSFAVRAVELTVGGAQPVLERFAQVTLPPGAVRNGEVVDTGAVAAAVKRLWAQGGFRTKRVVVGVANQRVIVRQAEVQAMSEGDLQAALQFEAQELIPIPIEDAILDFQVVEQTVGAEGEPRMRILLAAAQREMVRTQLAAVEGGGLGATAVDVTPFALVRATTLGAPAFEDTGAEAVVCIGGGVTNVVVHEQGIPRFVRVLLVGGDEITEAIARELNVDLDYAEDVKRRADATSGEEAVARAGQVVAQRLVPLVEEIRGSLDYYSAQTQSVPITRVLVTGGGSKLAGLMERLQSQLGARVEPARPLANVRTGAGVTEGQLAELEQLLTVPIGLALAGEVQKGVRRISLLPREIAVIREQRRQVVGVAVAVAGLAAVLLALWAARSAQVADERDKADEAEARVTRLEQEKARLADSTALTAELAERRGQIEFVLSDDVAWTRLFNDVANVIPNDVWLTSFTGAKGAPGTVNVAAMGFDQTSTARWLLRVGELKSLTALWVPSSTKTGTGAATVVNFQSQANLTADATAKRTARYTGEAQ